MRRFEVSSTLSVSAEAAWRHAVSPAGVNAEFHPLLRMTFPAGTGDLTTYRRKGQKLFRSWLLLGGVVPVDYDDVCFVDVDAGRRFLERSRLLSQRLWEHERIIEPVPGGCRLTDRLAFDPRVALLAPLYAKLFVAVFRLRHRNLRRMFAGAGVAEGMSTE